MLPGNEELPPAAHVLHFALPVAFSYVPTAQAAHAAGPCTSLYVPETHATHVPLPGPVYPTLQVLKHEAIDVLAIADVHQGGHDTQNVAPVVAWYVATGQLSHTDAPVVAEYIPTLQFLHAEFPVTTAYVPAAHGAQTVPFVVD